MTSSRSRDGGAVRRPSSRPGAVVVAASPAATLPRDMLPSPLRIPPAARVLRTSPRVTDWAATRAARRNRRMAEPECAHARCGPPAGLRRVAREWTQIGCVGFGGPPAHVALLRELCVEREGWLSSREFQDGLAAANLLPGPASTQMAILCAY